MQVFVEDRCFLLLFAFLLLWNLLAQALYVEPTDKGKVVQ
jgi:hypothetical protein